MRMTQPLPEGYDESDVVEGHRLSISPITGTVYLVTRWIEPDDDGRLIALSKAAVERTEGGALRVEGTVDDLPDGWREEVDGSVWSEEVESS